jgi:hypothetical protein
MTLLSFGIYLGMAFLVFLLALGAHSLVAWVTEPPLQRGWVLVARERVWNPIFWFWRKTPILDGKGLLVFRGPFLWYYERRLDKQPGGQR